jgi:hypothetical protein
MTIEGAERGLDLGNPGCGVSDRRGDVGGDGGCDTQLDGKVGRAGMHKSEWRDGLGTDMGAR